MNKRETTNHYFKDDHDRIISVIVDDFNDGRPPRVDAMLLGMPDAGGKWRFFKLPPVERPQQVAWNEGRLEDLEQKAKYCPLNAEWGDATTSSTVEVEAEVGNLYKIFGQRNESAGGHMYWEFLMDRIRKLHRMLTNVLVSGS